MSDKNPSGWKLLHDVQWMNIVNHDHAHHSATKDEAINTVFKMAEAKVREVNEPLMAELLAALSTIVKYLSDTDDEGLIEHAEPMMAAREAIAKALGQQPQEVPRVRGQDETDAARYRFIRYMVWDTRLFKGPAHMKILGELDAAVDAAMENPNGD